MAQRAARSSPPAPGFTITRGFTLRQSIARSAYEIVSRPLPGTIFALSLLVLLVGLVSVILDAPLPRIPGLILLVASVWSIWTPVSETIKAARKQAESWRVGDVVTSGSTADEYWIRTPQGQWRYNWARLEPVKRMFGFVIVEVDGNAFYHIAIPAALWLEPSEHG